MRIDDQRRSDNFEDRGAGAGGGGGLGPLALLGLFRFLGFRGMLIVGLIVGGIFLFGPPGLKSAIFGGGAGGGSTAGASRVCDTQAEACDFSRAVLGSTEDVWTRMFAENRLPNYGGAAGPYQAPTLAVFSGNVQTACGNAPSSVGPFYCPGDRKLYIDPGFYQTMQDRLNAPGDFAQAYVIAHEVAHHVQNLIGATQAGPRESDNQHSVRVELQADCLAGVWGHTAAARLQITQEDLSEALNAAHNIGDDALQRQAGQSVNPTGFTHGTSEQRMRWFRRGYDSGDPRQCDTFNTGYGQL